MRKLVQWAAVVAVAGSVSCAARAETAKVAAPDLEGTTPVWRQFVEAKAAGTEPVLPDFSYAGYHYGERPIPDVAGPVFNVADHGAIPDDGASDHDAIQATINAAEAAGGGVVLFPAGEFLVNVKPGDDPIVVSRGNIVVRGAGAGAGGTVLRQVEPYPPADPTKMYSCPFVFLVRPKVEISSEPLAKVTESAAREQYRVTVDDASPFKPGQRVTLRLRSPEAASSFLKPWPVEARFERLFTSGIEIDERHIVERVEGNTLVFREPLHVSVDPQFGWTITEYNVVEEVGFEDLCFMGGWRQPFIHHRTALDDGGWSALRIERVANSWVRRCSFLNVNNAVHLRESSQFTMLHVVMDGNGGHFGVHNRTGYGVWCGLMEDRALHWHGPSVGYQSSGSVYWRNVMGPDQRIDSHSGSPTATLMDAVDGGVLYGSGGPTAGLPHHLRYYTLWNFETRSTQYDEYDFWKDGKKERFVMPIVVGWHGTPVRFNEASAQLIESNGAAVKPESLWEAQIERRLGQRPAWIDEALTAWPTFRDQPLSDWPKSY